MASEGSQRQIDRPLIDRPLDEAEEAIAIEDWATVASRARAGLRVDPKNSDALSYLAAADRDPGIPAAQAVSQGLECAHNRGNVWLTDPSSAAEFVNKSPRMALLRLNPKLYGNLISAILRKIHKLYGVTASFIDQYRSNTPLKICNLLCSLALNVSPSMN